MAKSNASTFKVVTNREWINCCCFREDIAAVDRMFRHDLNAVGPGIDAPIWEKEMFYEKWLDMDFSPNNWSRAKTPSGTNGGRTGVGVGGAASFLGTVKIA